MNKKSEATVSFSKNMKFPESWKKLMVLDRRLEERRDESLVQERKRILQADAFIDVVIKNTSDPNGPGIVIPTKIKEMKNSSITIKLLIENPELVSMSSQNEKDTVEFKFKDGLILTDEDGNGLLLDKASKGPGYLAVSIPI